MDASSVGPRAGPARLQEMAAGGDIDLALLDGAGPVLREQALVHARPLYEYRPASIPAASEYFGRDVEQVARRARDRPRGSVRGVARPASP